MFENEISCGVSPGIIDLFEMIDIKKNQGEPHLISAIIFRLFLQHFVEVPLVVDACQAILDGHIAQHRVIFRVVIVLVSKLEDHMTNRHLVSFA